MRRSGKERQKQREKGVRIGRKKRAQWGRPLHIENHEWRWDFAGAYVRVVPPKSMHGPLAQKLHSGLAKEKARLAGSDRGGSIAGSTCGGSLSGLLGDTPIGETLRRGFMVPLTDLTGLSWEEVERRDWKGPKIQIPPSMVKAWVVINLIGIDNELMMLCELMSRGNKGELLRIYNKVCKEK